MSNLLSNCWQICLFKRGPQDLTFSIAALIAVLVLEVSLNCLEMSMIMPWPRALLQVFTTITISTLFLYMVLYWADFSDRIVQTLTALYGTGLIVYAFFLPVLLLQFIALQFGAGTLYHGMMLVALLAMLALNIWQVMIVGHIIKEAMEMPFVLGLLVAFAIVGLEIMVIQWIFR